MQPEVKEAVKEFKEKVRALYGGKYKTMLLYGSWARGDAQEDSDIDVAVVLKGDVSPGKEIDHMIDIITEINMNHNVLISVYPVSETVYNSVKSPLLLNIRRAGVTI